MSAASKQGVLPYKTLILGNNIFILLNIALLQAELLLMVILIYT